jgi:hypothetical protein
MHQWIILSLGVLASVFAFTSHAQPVSKGTPAEQAAEFAELIRTNVSACVLNVAIVKLARDVHKRDPNNPTGMSASAATKSLQECTKTSLSGIPRMKAERIDSNAALLTKKCKTSIDTLYVAYVAHLENFAVDRTESLQALEDRVKVEAQQVRNQATQARISCSS